MTKLTTVRDVNPNLWRELKVEAIKEGLTMGEAMNLALEKWLQDKETKKTKKGNFWDLKPFKFEGKDAGFLSKKVDEALYGWKI